MIVLCHDELKVCNPLGSKAGVHRVDMFYSVANLDPKFRSKHCAIRLSRTVLLITLISLFSYSLGPPTLLLNQGGGNQ